MEHDFDKAIRPVFDALRASARAAAPRHVYKAIVSALRGELPDQMVACVAESDGSTRWQVIVTTPTRRLITLDAVAPVEGWHLEEGDGVVPEVLEVTRRHLAQLASITVTGIFPGSGPWGDGDNFWRTRWRLNFRGGSTFEIVEPDSRGEAAFQRLLEALEPSMGGEED